MIPQYWSYFIFQTIKSKNIFTTINFFFELISTYLAGWINMYLKAILLIEDESKPLAYIR